MLKRFEEFCRVDLQQADRSVRGNLWELGRFLKCIDKSPTQVTTDDLRGYLARFQSKSPSTRANVLKAFKRFFRDFLQRPDLVQSFKFPRRTYTPKTVPSKEDLRRFFDALETDRDRAAFLLFATSGLRRSELLSLRLDEMDLESRTIIPRRAHQSSNTKSTWVTFFNHECQEVLKRYLANRRTNKNNQAISIGESTLRRNFKEASQKSGVKLGPQTLRIWFSCQLGRLGIPDRYIDAMLGHSPRSILSRHYSDFSPDKMREIYDKVDLRVLS